MKTPAVGVFAYNRPDSLARTLGALEACSGFAGGRVHVFCDDAADESAREGVERTRAVADGWCRRTGGRVVRRTGNRGFKNLSDGVGELTAEFGSAISMDDDHEASPHLLAFLDRALAAYRDDSRVFQIAAYFPGVALPADVGDTFFFPVPMSMAWGTWERAWSHFQWNIDEAGRQVLDDPAARRRFDLDDRYRSSRLLAKALSGEFNSYYIRWYLAMFLAGGLALCTRRSLVRNFGFTGGVHPGPALPERETFFNGRWAGRDVDPSTWTLPDEVSVDRRIIDALCEGVRATAITRNLLGTPPRAVART